MSYEDPVDHLYMALDDYRNGFYERALAESVGPSSVVLDAGAGIGVLGLTAAKLGAKRVYLVEPSTDMEAARIVAADNGLGESLMFLPDRVEEAFIEVRADIITSVFTGNFLLEEDLLPSLFVARDRFLRKEGRLIPNAGRMMAYPVSMPAYYEKHIETWSGERTVNHSAIRRFAVNHIYYADFRDDYRNEAFIPLAEAAVLKDLDFMTATSASCRSDITYRCDEPGTCHGFMGWFDIDFGGERLSTAPEAPETHWSQAFLPLEQPISLEKGDTIELQLRRPEFGEWSWMVSANGQAYRHSTFLSRPMSTMQLSRASSGFQPSLNEQGMMLLEMFSLMQGTRSSQEIAAILYGKFPRRFANEQAAERFVINQARRYSE